MRSANSSPTKADDIARLHRGPSRGGDLADQRIARGEPRSIVDLLEAIEIEKHQRQLHFSGAHVFQCLVETIVEIRSVGEPSQRVME